jgi:hypothetical protein
MNVEVEVFSALVGLLVIPTTAENTSTSTFIQAPDDGHNNAGNMLSSVCTTLASFPCKLNTFRKRVKNAINSSGD